MKPCPILIFFALSLLLFASACGARPTPAPATLPPVADTAEAPTVAPSLTPTATETPLPVLPTASPTSAITRKPTATSPYPLGLDTPMPDLGFSVIDMENVAQLRPLYQIEKDKIWHSVTSGDGQKMFVATTNGIFVYDRQGKQLAHWPSLLTHDLPGEQMLTINRDGSRFALITRNAGRWEARLYYNVAETDPILTLALPLDGDFEDIPRILLSPDDRYLTYGAGRASLHVISLDTKLEAFQQPAGIASIAFSPDASLFAAQRGRELVLWKTSAWKNPVSMVLPRDDTPYAFSPDGKKIVLAQPAQIRVVTLETLKTAREISIKTSSQSNWQVQFIDAKTLRGVKISWNDRLTSATVNLAEWNIESGETLRMETSQTDTPDALSALWGVPITASAPPFGFQFGPYQGFRFVGADMLMVNAPHSACWLQLSTAAKNCFQDLDRFVYAGDVGAFREIRNSLNTVLQDWRGGTVLEAGAYHIIAVTQRVDFALINVNDLTTDLYAKGKTVPSESVAGVLRGLAENSAQLAFSALEASNATSITVVEKSSRATLWQKKENFLLKPLAMTKTGVIYCLKYDLDRQQTILIMIDTSAKFNEVTRLDLTSEAQVMVLSSTGLFALGLQDGSVVVMTQNGSQNAAFQAAHSPISALSFSLDGKFLAVASEEGIRVWGLEP